MKKLLLLLLLLSFGCQHIPKDEPNSTDPIDGIRQSFREYNSKNSGKLSQEFVKILKQSKSFPVKEKFSLYDLMCSLKLSGDTPYTECNFYLTSSDSKKRREKSFKGPLAEELRLLLSSFPVSQGDSGAATSYLACYDANTEGPSCELAMNLNYEGP